MLKLLKYDLKRNLNTFASLFVLLIILQGTITILGNTRHWDPVIIVFLIMMLYSLTGTMLGIMSVNTYNKNIKSYSRRLVPKRPIWHVISSMVLGLAAQFILIILMIIHVLIYYAYVDDLGKIFSSISISFWSAFSIIIQFVLFFIFLYCAIVLSATITASIKAKVGVWVGIGAFFVIQAILWKVQNTIFSALGLEGEYPYRFVRQFEQVDATNGAMLTVNGHFGAGWNSVGWTSVIIDLVFIASMLYATTWLLRHKEQV